MNCRIRFFSRGPGLQFKGYVVDENDEPIEFDSKKKAKRTLRSLIENAEPGEFYELEDVPWTHHFTSSTRDQQSTVSNTSSSAQE